MNAERNKREARKIMYFERYTPVILRILMYGEADTIKLGKTFFPSYFAVSPKTNNIYCKTNHHGTAVGIIVVRLFIECL